MQFRIKQKRGADLFPVKIKQVTAPVIEPVTLREVKDFLFITHEDDDSLLWNLIVAARQECERYTKRSLITQTWEASFRRYPIYQPMNLRYGPIQTVDEIRHIKRYETIADAVVVDADQYYLTDEHNQGKVALQTDRYWSNDTLRDEDAVQVTYTAGYGDTYDDVPPLIRLGILQYIANVYERRDEDALTEGVMMKWNQFKMNEKSSG